MTINLKIKVKEELKFVSIVLRVWEETKKVSRKLLFGWLLDNYVWEGCRLL